MAEAGVSFHGREEGRREAEGVEWLCHLVPKSGTQQTCRPKGIFVHRTLFQLRVAHIHCGGPISTTKVASLFPHVVILFLILDYSQDSQTAKRVKAFEKFFLGYVAQYNLVSAQNLYVCMYSTVAVVSLLVCVYVYVTQCSHCAFVCMCFALCVFAYIVCVWYLLLCMNACAVHVYDDDSGL